MCDRRGPVTGARAWVSWFVLRTVGTVVLLATGARYASGTGGGCAVCSRWIAFGRARNEVWACPWGRLQGGWLCMAVHIHMYAT